MRARSAPVAPLAPIAPIAPIAPGPAFSPANDARAVQRAAYNVEPIASNMSEGTGMAAVEIIADVAASGAGELAVEGIFAIIAALFD